MNGETILTVSVALLAVAVIGMVVYGLIDIARRRVRAWNAAFDTGGAGSVSQARELHRMREARTTELPRADFSKDPEERRQREAWRQHIYAEITEINDRFEQLTAQFEPIVWKVNVPAGLSLIAPDLDGLATQRTPEEAIAWAVRPNDLPPPPWRAKRVPLVPLARAIKEYERELAAVTA